MIYKKKIEFQFIYVNNKITGEVKNNIFSQKVVKSSGTSKYLWKINGTANKRPLGFIWKPKYRLSTFVQAGDVTATLSEILSFENRGWKKMTCIPSKVYCETTNKGRNKL